MKRLAFLHTVPVLVEKFRELAAERLSGIKTFHMLDESLLQDLMLRGASETITRRVVTFSGLAYDAGADVIVFTCSSTSPAIDTARACIPVPILKIDDPMAERAVELGPRISILCTTTSTQEPSRMLVESHARRLGREVRARSVLVGGAFDSLRAGDRATHDDLIGRVASQSARDSDVLVLAQASMAHLAEPLTARLPIPVLSSPPLLMDALVRMRGT